MVYDLRQNDSTHKPNQSWNHKINYILIVMRNPICYLFMNKKLPTYFFHEELSFFEKSEASWPDMHAVMRKFGKQYCQICLITVLTPNNTNTSPERRCLRVSPSETYSHWSKLLGDLIPKHRMQTNKTTRSPLLLWVPFWCFCLVIAFFDC